MRSEHVAAGGGRSLYGPSPVQRSSFDVEPTEVRWVLRSHDQDVEVLIYRFPDMSTSFDLPDDEGELSWSSTQLAARLG
jgi:hypothetical protein